MFELAPSMLSADFSKLGEQLELIEKCGCRYLHIDVMDGMFVPQISFGMPVIASIRKCSGMIFDVHMMVDDPGRYVHDMKAAGADLLSVHVEACRHLDRVLSQIREEGMKAGAVLNPATPLCSVAHVLDRVDFILLMSVNPGYGGQNYIHSVTGKIRDLRKMLDESVHPDIVIEVDGGVNAGTADEVMDAGAEWLVAGSSVFKGDIAGNIRMFREKFALRQ